MSVRMGVCAHYLRFRDELRDFLACVKWSHFNMGHPPVSPPRRLQNLVMLLQDLPETCEIQILWRHRGRFFKPVKTR